MNVPVKEIPKDQLNKILHGSGKRKFVSVMKMNLVKYEENEILFEGVIAKY